MRATKAHQSNSAATRRTRPTIFVIGIAASFAPLVMGAQQPLSVSSRGVVTIAGVGFSSPENLVYDRQANVYLVANINGDARARDSNGFIIRVAPDGKILQLKWIDGSHAATRLDGPKGLAIHGDTLVVADVGTVRFFDRRTGHARNGKLAITSMQDNKLYLLSLR